MNTKVRRRSFWSALLPAIVLMVLQEGMSMFMMQIVMLKEFASAKVFDMSEILDAMSNAITTQSFLMITSCLYGVMAIIVFGLWYRSENVVSPEENGGFSHNDTLRGYSPLLYVGVVLFAIAAQYLCTYILTISATAFPEWVETYESLMEMIVPSGGGFTLVLTVLFLSILGPVCEELCFRGVTYSLARYSMPHWGANVLQAILFAGVHANPLQCIYTFLFGLILGQVVGKTGNIIITILMHAAFNTMSILIENYLIVGDTAVTFYCILLLSMIGTYIGYRLIMYTQAKYADVQNTSKENNA